VAGDFYETKDSADKENHVVFVFSVPRTTGIMKSYGALKVETRRAKQYFDRRSLKNTGKDRKTWLGRPRGKKYNSLFGYGT
jgi:hypothetical protein